MIGVHVFDKEQSFDPRADPIVRVQARRLRARVVRYYREEARPDELVIDLPKGALLPRVQAREARPVDAEAVHHRGPSEPEHGRRAAVRGPQPRGDLGYFCSALRQEVIHALAAIQTLRVLAWDPAEPGVAADPRQAVQTARAAMVITGSVRRSGDKLRVTTHLVDGASGSYAWSETLDSTATDFAAQEAVAHAVVKKLQPDGAAGAFRGRRPAENLAARNLYLQGRYHLNQRTEESLRKAVDFFERAIVEDASIALAHSGLADGHGLLAHYGVLRAGRSLGESRLQRRDGGHARRPVPPRRTPPWRT